MRTQYKTQCPRCQTIYPMPNDKLDQPKARANCGKCHHTFFLNAHIIKPTDEQFAPQADKADDKPVAPKKPSTPAPTAPKASTPVTKAPTPQATAPSPALPAGIVSAQQAVAEANNISISAKSSQTIADLVKKQPELATAHILPTSSSNANSTTTAEPTSSDLFAELDGLIGNKIKENTQVSNAPTAPTQHQSQNHSDEVADFDGLSDFMNDTLASDKTEQPKAPKGGEEDAWLDELLKDEKKSASTVISAINQSPTPKKAEKVEDDPFGGAFGDEFDHIPAVAAPTLDKKELQKKAEQRITSQAPSQEQLAKKRSAFGQFMWLVGSLILLALMGVQYVIFNADNIAKHPAQAQMVQSICMGCTLPKADPNAFSNSYEVYVSQKGGTNLIGTLKNNSGEDQLYPNLKVSVRGNNGLLGEFVASPKDYLVAPQRLLATGQGKRYMFTLNSVNPQEISKVTIEPFY